MVTGSWIERLFINLCHHVLLAYHPSKTNQKHSIVIESFPSSVNLLSIIQLKVAIYCRTQTNPRLFIENTFITKMASVINYWKYHKNYVRKTKTLLRCSSSLDRASSSTFDGCNSQIKKGAI